MIKCLEVHYHLLELLDRQKIENISAILLRVNSPGSGVTDAEAVHNKLRFYKQLNVPVVASFEAMATSGAYLVSCAVDHIFAYQNSIVGSVGVIMEVPQFKTLMDSLGVNLVSVRSGPLKAASNPFESLNQNARTELQRVVNQSARWFLKLVKENRHLSTDVMTQVSKGGIFTGSEARVIGLVDELGEDADALEWLYKKGVDSSIPFDKL